MINRLTWSHYFAREQSYTGKKKEHSWWLAEKSVVHFKNILNYVCFEKIPNSKWALEKMCGDDDDDIYSIQ